jgi:hypothetical protein
MSDEPTIPTAPTEPISPNGDEPDDKKSKSKGGRPSNADLAADNKRLADECAALRLALAHLAAIPDDPTKKDDAVLYELSRSGQACKLTAGQIRRARKLL